VVGLLDPGEDRQALLLGGGPYVVGHQPLDRAMHCAAKYRSRAAGMPRSWSPSHREGFPHTSAGNGHRRASERRRTRPWLTDRVEWTGLLGRGLASHRRRECGRSSRRPSARHPVRLLSRPVPCVRGRLTSPHAGRPRVPHPDCVECCRHPGDQKAVPNASPTRSAWLARSLCACAGAGLGLMPRPRRLDSDHV
jgi:hypothetical protein